VGVKLQALVQCGRAQQCTPDTAKRRMPSCQPLADSLWIPCLYHVAVEHMSCCVRITIGRGLHTPNSLGMLCMGLALHCSQLNLPEHCMLPAST
jgi:hypothetical protein